MAMITVSVTAKELEKELSLQIDKTETERQRMLLEGPLRSTTYERLRELGYIGNVKALMLEYDKIQRKESALPSALRNSIHAAVGWCILEIERKKREQQKTQSVSE